MADIGTGYITAYNPDKATVDVRTDAGVPFNDQPFDSSLGIYVTPVLPIITGTTGSNELTTHIGSRVIYAAIDDANIRIIRIYNDDPLLVSNMTGVTKYRGDVQDSLIRMLQQGETLVSSPGKLELGSDGKYSRTRGGWMLFRNGGDVFLSNANTSAQAWFKDSGVVDIKSVEFSLMGTLTSLVETSDGTFMLTSGRKAQSGLTVDPEGILTLYSGSSSLEIDDATTTLGTQELLLSVGNEAAIDAATLGLNATTLNATATTLTLNGDTLDLNGINMLTIKCGDNSITVSKLSGIDIQAGAGQYVKISNGTATFPLVYSTNTFSRDVLKLEDLKTSKYVSVGL